MSHQNKVSPDETLSADRISYVESKAHLCRANFRGQYIVGLTRREEYVSGWGLLAIEVGATEYRAARSKAAEFDDQQQWADDWLEQRGYLDRMLRDHGLSIPSFSRSAFEQDLYEDFPNFRPPIVRDRTRKKSAIKLESTKKALLKRGYCRGEKQGKTNKQIAKEIESDIPGVLGESEESRAKMIERALKDLI
jgi:hypothetical protein